MDEFDDTPFSVGRKTKTLENVIPDDVSQIGKNVSD